jgi:hypothetical protein
VGLLNQIDAPSPAVVGAGREQEEERAKLMHCPVYRATIPTSLCLTYQSRAAGNISPRDKLRAKIECWKDRHRVCLTCETGKEVKKNGGKDMDGDVQRLKESASHKRSGQICTECGIPQDYGNFYETAAGSGKYVKVCKECTKNRVKRQAKAKREALHKQAEKQAAQIIAKNIDRDINGLPFVENAIPEKLTNDITDVITKPPDIHTCRDCGHQGPADKDFNKMPHGGYSTVCRKCVAGKIGKTANKKRIAEKVDGGDCILLDFTEFPEILATLTSQAKENFRTINNEILFRLVNHG